MAEDKGQPTEKKIIIDEDWKAQVQAEKNPAADDQSAQEQPVEATRRTPIPPANILFLFSTLATQALLSLGLAPNPVSGKTETDLDQAKHFIDMLAVLEEKTKGNLSVAEKKQLDSLLFELRMQFVENSSAKI